MVVFMQSVRFFVSCAGVPQNAVPDGIVVAVVEVFVLQLKLHQDAGLCRVSLAPVAGRAGDVHPHLGAGVAAENAAVLYKGGLCTLPRGSHGRAEAAHAAADHDDIKMPFLGSLLRVIRNFVNVFFHCAPHIEKR